MFDAKPLMFSFFWVFFSSLFVAYFSLTVLCSFCSYSFILFHNVRFQLLRINGGLHHRFLLFLLLKWFA